MRLRRVDSCGVVKLLLDLDAEESTAKAWASMIPMSRSAAPLEAEAAAAVVESSSDTVGMAACSSFGPPCAAAPTTPYSAAATPPSPPSPSPVASAANRRRLFRNINGRTLPEGRLPRPPCSEGSRPKRASNSAVGKSSSLDRVALMMEEEGGGGGAWEDMVSG